VRNYCSGILILLLTFLGFHELHAQEGLKSVEGVVVDSTGLGMKDASVRLVSNADTMSTTTDENGFYRFRNIKGKNLNISYSMLGF